MIRWLGAMYVVRHEVGGGVVGCGSSWGYGGLVRGFLRSWGPNGAVRLLGVNGVVSLVKVGVVVR